MYEPEVWELAAASDPQDVEAVEAITAVRFALERRFLTTTEGTGDLRIDEWVPAITQ